MQTHIGFENGGISAIGNDFSENSLQENFNFSMIQVFFTIEKLCLLSERFSWIFFSLFTESEVRSSLVGSGNMISICTCLTQLDKNFVRTLGVFLLDHILLIVLRYLSDEPTVNIS